MFGTSLRLGPLAGKPVASKKMAGKAQVGDEILAKGGGQVEGGGEPPEWVSANPHSVFDTPDIMPGSQPD